MELYVSYVDHIIICNKTDTTITDEFRKGLVDPLRATYHANHLLIIAIEHKLTKKRVNKLDNFRVGKILNEKLLSFVNPKQKQLPITFYVSKEVAFYDELPEIYSLCNCEYTGEYKMWSNNGQLIMNSWISNDEFNENKENFCYFDNGYPEIEEYFENGKKVYKEYYENGNIKNSSYSIDGLSQDEYVDYFDDNKIKCKCFYNNGKLNGEYLEFYDNGNLACKCNYKDDILVGSYEDYYKNGNKQTECVYDENGKILTVQKYSLKLLCGEIT